ncbi:MAG TPA: energy transducer TonB [Opitutaceae bacterium]|nr:energy transducer TonB [Opitutaceae bacterium]
MTSNISFLFQMLRQLLDVNDVPDFTATMNYLKILAVSFMAMSKVLSADGMQKNAGYYEPVHVPMKNGDFYEDAFSVIISVAKAEPRSAHLPLPTNQPIPPFPMKMREARIEGQVVVRFEIAADGRVKRFRIIEDGGEPEFTDTVRSTISQWRFGPVEDSNGKGTEITLDYRFRFLLGDHAQESPPR